jgi:multiple sugar transport system permease protein
MSASYRRQWLAYLPLVAGSLLMLFPLWWMAAVSLETAERAGAATVGEGGLLVVPDSPQWHNYPDALAQVGSEPWEGFLDALANSTVVTTLCVLGTILSSSLVGFGFARMRFRGREPLFTLMLATMMLPLIVPAFFGNAFFIFMFRQFIAQIPEALFEAARIDGCSTLGLWWRILLPLCRPVVAITAVFTFIFVWNDFLIPLIYLHSDDKVTLAVALNSFRNQYGGLEQVNYLMAVSIVTMLPCILLFFAAQRQFVDGLGKGAVKG